MREPLAGKHSFLAIIYANLKHINRCKYQEAYSSPRIKHAHTHPNTLNTLKKKDLRAGGLSSASSEARYRIRGVCLRD